MGVTGRLAQLMVRYYIKAIPVECGGALSLLLTFPNHVPVKGVFIYGGPVEVRWPRSKPFLEMASLKAISRACRMSNSTASAPSFRRCWSTSFHAELN